MAPGWLQCEPVFSRAFTKNELRICELVYMAVRRDNVFRPIHPSISMREGTGKTRRAWWNVPAVRSNVVAVQLEDKSSHLFACRTSKNTPIVARSAGCHRECSSAYVGSARGSWLARFVCDGGPVPCFLTPETGSKKLEVVIKPAGNHGLSKAGLLLALQFLGLAQVIP